MFSIKWSVSWSWVSWQSFDNRLDNPGSWSLTSSSTSLGWSRLASDGWLRIVVGQPRQGRGQAGAVAVEAGVAASDLAVHISGNVTEIVNIWDGLKEIPKESESVVIIGLGNKVLVLSYLLPLSLFLLLSKLFFNYLCLLDLGTAIAFNGGNLSLVLEMSSLEAETYWESWELFLVLRTGWRSLWLPSKLLLLELWRWRKLLDGWLQPRYFILASLSSEEWMESSSSCWLLFCCWSFLTKSSASLSFLRKSGGMLVAVALVGEYWAKESWTVLAVSWGVGSLSCETVSSSSSDANLLKIVIILINFVL